MEYQDKLLTCVECGQQFTFTAGEQEFYALKDFKADPKRCRPCREARKLRAAGDGDARGAASGRREERAPPAAGGRGGRAARAEMLFEGVCAACGKPARVRFRPTQGRPVYCDACFVALKR